MIEATITVLILDIDKKSGFQKNPGFPLQLDQEASTDSTGL